MFSLHVNGPAIDKKKKVSANRKPVYISLTSMFNRQQRLYECLFNLLKQSYKPDKIYIYLSEDPSFFDNGFINKSDSLNVFE